MLNSLLRFIPGYLKTYPIKMLVFLGLLITIKTDSSSHDARLNSHYKTWSYKKKSTNKLKHTESLFRKNLQLKDAC